MLKQIRLNFVQLLWEQYCEQSNDWQQIQAALQQRNIHHFPLDHFAIIDLPGPETGIPPLLQIFSALGYVERGKDYLAKKQNDFLWMAEADYANRHAHAVLPQVVIADFRLNAMPDSVSHIIRKYSEQAAPSPITALRDLTSQIHAQDSAVTDNLMRLLKEYFSGRDWPLPTVQEFRTVRAFNELLAWVLIFGRKPNHFTLSIHLLEQFASLDAFHQFVERDVGVKLNYEGGIIKGNQVVGIAQGSTLGVTRTIELADGFIQIPSEFVEFAWRYPIHKSAPILWEDYFTGFVASNADHVIESLYT